MRRPAMLTCGILLAAASRAAAADVTGRVAVTAAPGSNTSLAVVYAEPLDRAAPQRPVTAKLVQKDKTFSPTVLVVPVGTTVEFPNFDPIFHNVFSLSSPAPFDLGLYRAGQAKIRVFTQPATYRVFCNIHPQMTALIVVAPTPYAVAAGKDGRYRLDLPAGRYRVTARSDRAAPVSLEITVATAPLPVPDLALDESRYVVEPHKNKFGQNYPASAYTNK